MLAALAADDAAAEAEEQRTAEQEAEMMETVREEAAEHGTNPKTAGWHGYLFFGNLHAFGTERIRSRASRRRPARSGSRCFGAQDGTDVLHAPLAGGCAAASHNMMQTAAEPPKAAAASTRCAFVCGPPSCDWPIGGASPVDGLAASAAPASVEPVGRAEGGSRWLAAGWTPQGTSLRCSPAAAAGTSGTRGVAWTASHLQQAYGMSAAVQDYNQSMAAVDVHTMERPDLADSA